MGIDLSPAMLARAERRRLSLRVGVELRQMDVTWLGFEDNSFDAAVATFLFCILSNDLQVPSLRDRPRGQSGWHNPSSGICAPAGRSAENHHAAMGALGSLGVWSRL